MFLLAKRTLVFHRFLKEIQVFDLDVMNCRCVVADLFKKNVFVFLMWFLVVVWLGGS